MAMVTGAEYLKRIAQLESTIWIDGEFVKGKSTEHPAFKAVLEAKASLYDMVLDDDYADILQASDKNANFSFEIPRTKADLTKRRKATQLWAQSTLGVLGRSPEYVNTMIAIMAGAKDFFAEDGKEYGESIQSIYERAVKNDYTFTHTFVNPSISRKPFYPDGESCRAARCCKDYRGKRKRSRDRRSPAFGDTRGDYRRTVGPSISCICR